jgi:hypothetical protein
MIFFYGVKASKSFSFEGLNGGVILGWAYFGVHELRTIII